MVEEELESLRAGIVDLDFDGVIEAAKEAMSRGISPVKAIDSMAAGMKIVGERFENKEYFLSELIVSAEVMKEGMKIVEPYLKPGQVEAKGRVVLATVEGDLHDIGKNIVATLLRASGFEVTDLGVDVPTEEIVDAVRENKPQILGMSALTTLTMTEMGVVIKALEKADLRRKLKVIVGGTAVTEEFAEKIGADHRAADAVGGVDRCRQWVSGVR
ncbi:MAG: B12-binding domain-containing protein [Candidatus Bathyarchaeia archaeon]